MVQFAGCFAPEAGFAPRRRQTTAGIVFELKIVGQVAGRWRSDGHWSDGSWKKKAEKERLDDSGCMCCLRLDAGEIESWR